jgi:quercetin dioxygenase-like cupin family protein
MKKVLFVGALIALAGSALAQDAMKITTVTPDALVWKDNPNIPKGGQVAVLLGDPTKAGEVVVQRVKLPPNYQVPPHTHPYAETVTLISGSVGFGMGEKFDNKGALAKPGTFFANPAKHAYFVWTGNEEAIIQVQFIGPGASTTSTRLTILAKRQTKRLQPSARRDWRFLKRQLSVPVSKFSSDVSSRSAVVISARNSSRQEPYDLRRPAICRCAVPVAC